MCGIRTEATIGRFKQVIGDGTEQRRAAEVDVAVHALETHTGTGTPGLRPHRLTPGGAGLTAPCHAASRRSKGGPHAGHVASRTMRMAPPGGPGVPWLGTPAPGRG